jgi:hypothetical protein
MSETMQTMRYVLELCDTSGTHRPVAILQSTHPFPTVNLGDRFDDEGWARLDQDDEPGTKERPRRYVVHSIKHVVRVEADAIVARYCLNLTPHEGARSPAWGDDDPPLEQ